MSLFSLFRTVAHISLTGPSSVTEPQSGTSLFNLEAVLVFPELFVSLANDLELSISVAGGSAGKEIFVKFCKSTMFIVMITFNIQSWVWTTP